MESVAIRARKILWQERRRPLKRTDILWLKCTAPCHSSGSKTSATERCSAMGPRWPEDSPRTLRAPCKRSMLCHRDTSRVSVLQKAHCLAGLLQRVYPQDQLHDSPPSLLQITTVQPAKKWPGGQGGGCVGTCTYGKRHATPRPQRSGTARSDKPPEDPMRAKPSQNLSGVRPGQVSRRKAAHAGNRQAASKQMSKVSVYIF